jgi:tRNA-binding EMAP/Myf-like protein
VLELEAVAGKDKLKQLKVDVGSGDPLQIVTNAPNVVEGCLCVVATVGRCVCVEMCGTNQKISVRRAVGLNPKRARDPSASLPWMSSTVRVIGHRDVSHPLCSKVTMNNEEIEVKEATVGGVKSAGMLCDSTMLGWSGGGAGNAALVPDSFAPGDSAPEKRPRMDGGSTDESKKKGEVEAVMSAKDKRKAEAAAKKVREKVRWKGEGAVYKWGQRTSFCPPGLDARSQSSRCVEC